MEGTGAGAAVEQQAGKKHHKAKKHKKAKGRKAKGNSGSLSFARREGEGIVDTQGVPNLFAFHTASV